MHSWQIFKRSLIVLKENKRLLLFPIVTLALTLVIAILSLMPAGALLAFMDSGYSWKQAEHWQVVQKRFSSNDDVASIKMVVTSSNSDGTVKSSHYSHNVGISGFRTWILYGYLAVLYFGSMFLATFFNVAFYNEVLKVLNGETVSIKAGLKVAMKRWKAILFWSLLAGIVGYLIRLIGEKLGFVGSWIMRFVGLAWSVAAVFIAPVIIRDQEENNPVRCLKKSAGIIRRTWGEGLVGYVGMSGIVSLFVIVPVVTIIVAFAFSLILSAQVPWLAPQVVPIVFAVCAVIWLLLCCVLGYVCSVLEKIYIGALYIYGTEGVIPEAFDKETLDMAWKVRQGK